MKPATLQVDKEREREKEKAMQMKEDDLASGSGKRRRIKRDHLPGNEMLPNFGAALAPMSGPSLPYEGRDRDRKGGSLAARGALYVEEPYDKGPSSGRVHGKDSSKVTRREHDQYPFILHFCCMSLPLLSLCFLL